LANAGALFGILVLIIGGAVVYIKIKRSKRRWKKYAEEQIYRPDEWETKCQADRYVGSGKQLDKPGITEDTTDRADGGREVVPPKSATKNKRGRKRIKGNNKAVEQPLIAIPDIEQIEE